jgi:hypothetical protein
MMKLKILPFMLIFILLGGGCMKKIQRIVAPDMHNGRYDNEFSSGNGQAELASVTKSVRKLFCVDFYTTWQFNRSARVTQEDIVSGRYRQLALGIISTHETNSGTATVLLSNEHRLALLTCAHILNSHDTIISNYAPVADDPYAYIKSISVREKQELYIKDLPECGTFTTLALDRENDLALIGKRCEGNIDSVKVFTFPPGKAQELGWGSRVYILGYPMGNLMMTRGMVSPATGKNGGTFMVDAVLNKGYSGGIILAVRDGAPNFEMAGIVKSMSTHLNYYLRPEKEINEMNYSAFIPYSGDIYTGTDESVNYGINYVVAMETITSFYRKNRDGLVSQGYNLDSFFNR